MSPLLTILGFYYLCDQAAIERALSHDEAARCMSNYEDLKMAFVEDQPARLGSPERAAQIRKGYRGFKDWEAAHPDLVEDPRGYARAQLRQG